MPAKITTFKKAPSRRIVAFDIIRGFFLVIILINHIELYPSGYDFFTGRGRLLVSAAEGFFFMSGLLVGLVYRRRLANGMKFIFKKMWTRALELYVGSVILTMLFTYAAVSLGHPSIKYGLPAQPIDWWHTLWQAAQMRYGFGWADFLDRFAILMLLAPLGFYLLATKRWKLLLGASLLGWAFRGQSFTAAWQLLFFGAMIIGYHWQELGTRWEKLSQRSRRSIKRWSAWATIVTFALSYASVYILSVLNGHIADLPHRLSSLTLGWNGANEWVWQYAQKWTLGPLRVILFILWFSALFMIVQKHQAAIKKYSKGFFELLGSNSLFVYIAHSFIVFTFKLFIPATTNLVENFAITSAAILCLISITFTYKKYHPTIAIKKTYLYQRLPWLPANVES